MSYNALLALGIRALMLIYNPRSCLANCVGADGARKITSPGFDITCPLLCLRQAFLRKEVAHYQLPHWDLP